MLPLMTVARGPAQIIVGVVLQNISSGAGAQRLDHELPIGVHRKDDHSNFRSFNPESVRHLDTVEPWHRDIEDRYIRVQVERLGKRLQSVGGSCNDIDEAPCFRAGISIRPERFGGHRPTIPGSSAGLHFNRAGKTHGGSVSRT